MPITTVPAKTSISRRTIQLKPITGSRRMATISLHHSRTIPTRTHRSSPCRICPGYAGQQHPRRYVWQWSAIWSVGCLRFVRPRIWLGRSRLRAADSAAQPAQPIYGQPTYGPTDYAQSAQTPYYQEPTQPNTRSPHTISHQPTRSRPTIRRPTAARLWLRAEVEDRRRPARPVPRHPRRAQLLSGIYRQGRGSAVADPDRMDHPHRTDHSGIWL